MRVFLIFRNMQN